MIDAALARRLKLVGFDVDGVLTDNGVYLGMVGDHPVEFKRFHIQDGLGIRLLQTAGLAVVWVSGRESAATALRARELAIDEVIQDPSARKLPLFEALRERRGLAWEECAFVGDDLADLPLLTRVGLPIAVPNAVAEVKAAGRGPGRGGADPPGAGRVAGPLVAVLRGAWRCRAPSPAISVSAGVGSWPSKRRRSGGSLSSWGPRSRQPCACLRQHRAGSSSRASASPG